MNAPDEFALEPSPQGETIPARVVEELLHARQSAKDYTQAYSDACKAQAQVYGLKPGALKRYVNALEADNLEEVDAELHDLARLIG